MELLARLWEEHVAREPQFLLYTLLAIPIALLVFTALTLGRRAHLRGLADLIRFFFAPFAPRLFVVVMDAYGWRVGYDEEVSVEGVRGAYLLRIGPGSRVYRCLEDPLAYAEPVSLLDMKAPPGLPSPFGLVPRLIVAWIVAVMLSAIAFSQTAYITLVAFHAPPTWVDVATTLGFILTLAWYVRVVLDAVAATGLMLYAVEAPPAGPLIPIASRPEKLVEWIRLLRESVEKSDACKRLEELAKRYGLDKASLETLLAKAVDAEHWRRRVAALEEELDMHIAAAEAAALRAAPLPRRGLGEALRRAAPLLLAAALIAAALALQPSIKPIHTATTPTPAQPPPPPIPTAQVTAKPAQPPPPPYGEAATPTATPAPPPPPPNTTSQG